MFSVKKAAAKLGKNLGLVVLYAIAEFVSDGGLSGLGVSPQIVIVLQALASLALDWRKHSKVESVEEPEVDR